MSLVPAILRSPALRVPSCLTLFVGLVLLATPASAADAVADPFPERALDEAMAAELGAACRLPSDVAGFSATHDLDGLVMDVWNSQGVQSLLRSPAGLMGWMQLQQHPGYQQALRFAHSPMGREVLAALHQLIDDECFVALGADAAPRLAAISTVLSEFYIASMIEGFEAEMEGRPAQDPPIGSLVEALLVQRDELAVPSMLIGARLSQPELVQGLIDQWLPLAMEASTAGSYQAPPVDGLWSHHFVLIGQELLADHAQALTQELMGAGLRPSESAALVQWLGEQRLELELTLQDGYLLLHIGADRGLLEHWGATDSLAASEHFKPIRALHREGLVGVSYLSAAFAGLGGWTPAYCSDLGAEVEAYVLESEHLPPELKQRLLTDIPAFFADFAAGVDAPVAQTGCSYREQGLRTWRVAAGRSRRFAAAPPSTLHGFAGAAPLLGCSSFGHNDPADYRLLARWLSTGFDYARDSLLSQVDPAEQAEAEAALLAVSAFGDQLDQALVEDLLPALGPQLESLLVVEAGGRLQGLPPELGLGDGVAIPRAAIVISIADQAALLRGLGRLADAVDTLARELSALSDSQIPADFALPRPVREDEAGFARYRYPELAGYGHDLEAVAVVTDDVVIIGNSLPHLRQLLQRREVEAEGGLARQTDDALRFSLDVAGWSGFLVAAAGELIDSHVAHRQLRQQQAGELVMVLTHLQILDRALQSIAGISGSVRVGGDYTITETWLKTAQP